MYDEEGLVLEGLSSNVFVIMDQTLYTAPSDLVLEGTIRELLVNVCHSNQIPLVFQCPQVSHIDQWQAVLITSKLNKTPSLFVTQR